MAKSPAKSTKGNAPSTLAGAGCLILFALPFAAVGVVMAWIVARDLWVWRAAQSWVETPATLVAAKLEEEHDDGVTYKATAKYAYQFGGQQYTSERVALHDGSDNVGRYQEERGRELEQIMQAGGRLPCFVNPDDPAQAMLFRDLRPGMVAFKLMFVVMFGGAGFGLLAAATIGYGRVKREEQLKQAIPDKPWKWRDDWAAGRIRSSEGGLRWFVTIFAVGWNVLCWPVFLTVWTGEKDHGGPPTLLLALFPLVGIGVGLWAIYLWLRRLRWGASEFEMAAVPGVLGGPLAGVIHAPGGIVPHEHFVLRLACNKTTKGSRGGDSSSSTETLWDTETSIFRDLVTDQGNRTLIPVKFLVPYELPPSGDDVKWLLEAKAETTGVDYFASFEIPVFHTSASSQKVDEETSAAQSLEGAAPETLAATVARLGGVLEEELTTSRTILFPMARNRGLASFTALFALVWGGVCYGLFVSDAPRVFPWVASLFGLLLLYAAISSCFGSTRLMYNPQSVAYAHRLFGLGRWRDLPRSRIQSIAVDLSGTTAGGKAYRKIVAGTTDAGDVTLVNEAGRSQEAERLAEDMRNVLGLTESRSDGSSSRMALEAELPTDFRGE